jgi:hypothetical protein
MVRRFVEDAGGEEERLVTNLNPLAYRELMIDKRAMLLMCVISDSMAVDGERWVVPHYGAEIIELPGLGRCLVNWGSSIPRARRGGY